MQKNPKESLYRYRTGMNYVFTVLSVGTTPQTDKNDLSNIIHGSRAAESQYLITE